LPPPIDEREAQVFDAADLVERCRNAHSEVLAAVDEPATVVLRVFVLPDGKIAQGVVAASSGNSELDRAVFQCVQAYANLEPAMAAGSPVGSWQRLSTSWGH
jgi:TonB family protein